MFILEGRQVVNVLVDSDVQIVWLVMRRDVCLGEGFRHLALFNVSQSFQNQMQYQERKCNQFNFGGCGGRKGLK